MEHQNIQVLEKYGGQTTEIRLNSPPSNILNARMMDEISCQLNEAVKNPHLKLIVITGEGKHFSYGASVEEHLPGKVGVMLPDFHRLIGQILDLPVPTLALVSGFCLGGGFELALACSFLMADESAKFAVPEIQLGVFPPVAAALLPALTTGALTMRLILTGERLGAKEIFNAGLAHCICTAGNLNQDLSTFIEKQILPKSASSLRIAHRAARSAVSGQYRKSIGALEKLYLDELMATKDALEGLLSFVEKRQACWKDA